jgi:hypothetical protein
LIGIAVARAPFPAVAVVLFAEGGVRQHPVVGDDQRLLRHGRAELRRSLAGPRLAVAPVMKWLLVSQTTVSLVQSLEVCFLPARLKM